MALNYFALGQKKLALEMLKNSNLQLNNFRVLNDDEYYLKGTNLLIEGIYRHVTGENIDSNYYEMICNDYPSTFWNSRLHKATSQLVSSDFENSLETLCMIEEKYTDESKALNNEISFVQMKHLQAINLHLIARNKNESIAAIKPLFEAFSIAQKNGFEDQMEKIQLSINDFSQKGGFERFKKRLHKYPF